ncbi:hypothetical protein L226DRAFT_133310 [Lentinus tigrinus ALCF2SS1-7]|uniref:uncharacterized protein n=1 Tax=Lentinus tigrinus ALCF2SS1-7 TaxID=1328758 RepID=UPI001165FA4E|nr:hypothetical protein L226DRAFT_133310 [Lentinus tigrinus ALCF2SS1-7]
MASPPLFSHALPVLPPPKYKYAFPRPSRCPPPVARRILAQCPSPQARLRSLRDHVCVDRTYYPRAASPGSPNMAAHSECCGQPTLHLLRWAPTHGQEPAKPSHIPSTDVTHCNPPRPAYRQRFSPAVFPHKPPRLAFSHSCVHVPHSRKPLASHPPTDALQPASRAQKNVFRPRSICAQSRSRGLRCPSKFPSSFCSSPLSG